LIIIAGQDVYAATYDALTNYAAQKQAAGWSVHLTSSSAAISAVPPHIYPALYDSLWTTNDRADQIKAYLRMVCSTGAYSHLLLIGNPDPDDITLAADSVGDVPMKMLYALGTTATASIWFVPSDCFYRELNSDWDLNNNGVFAEWNGDRGAGGLSLSACQLSVGRIPCYGAGDHAAVRAILAKSLAYERDLPANFCAWRYRAFQPNPIDWSDNYYAEGNVSPIFMAESVRTSYFLPYGIATTRIYEDHYTYDPWFFDPTDIVPQPRTLATFTHYSSSYRFRALVNSSSDNYADYVAGIGELTDNSYATSFTRVWAPGDWLQFRLAQDDSRQYAPVRVELYAPAVTAFPAQVRLRFSASGSNWSDARTLAYDTNVWTHAVFDSASGLYRVVYDEEAGTLTRAGQRRYIRLEYPGAAAQSVTLHEVKGMTWAHGNIKPYVNTTWYSNGYGIVVFTTHGSQTTASEIISASEAQYLSDAQPGMIFLKACQTAWAEYAGNLAFALLKHGAIGSIGATRTSWGFSEHGHMMFFKHVVTNATYGDALRLVAQELETVNYYGWDGNYSDVFRFNLYGDPTLQYRLIRPQLERVTVNGGTSATAICVSVELTCEITANELPVTGIRAAMTRAGLTGTWHSFAVPYTYELPPVYPAWHTVWVEVCNLGQIRSEARAVNVYLVPEPGAGVWLALLLAWGPARRGRAGTQAIAG